MGEPSAEQIAERAADLGLLNDRQLEEVWGQFGSRNVASADFQDALLRREMLTSYQLSRLIRGDRTGYFYGNYKVLYLVGSGSFARVYRAEHTKTGELVAVKVLRNRYRKNPEQLEQFVQEGKVGHTLRHSNIVPIFEVGQTSAAHYLVMEFVEGQNLRNFVKVRERCEPLESLRLIGDVLRGLDYALDRGVTHRDIKLSNVLISTRGDAKLVDFGLAAAGKNATDTALIQSPNPRTIDYAALERTTGVKRDDPRSDLYFVGCMLYHMLTGMPPLSETKDRTKRMSKTRFFEVVPIGQKLPMLPQSVASLVNKAMELDPQRRHQTPREMLLEVDKTFGKVGDAEAAAKSSPHHMKMSESSLRLAARQSGEIASEPDAKRSVMFVESDEKMQDFFRSQFKSHGFRVLVTNDPARAIARFDKFEKGADCVVFSAVELGKRALEGFSQFARTQTTQDVPAILLLGKKQREWTSRPELTKQAVESKVRRVVKMPISLKDFCAVIDELAPAESPESV
ncbi:MAG: serine/threonine protein kinase [Planctomycetota bacterium]|nr:MAG: serine/threonine protein kinase [Planctomycetota bacterium]REJ93230.1 MAG: serine/threonine protein kinase [Planctomycetota bacterium]REK26032.1 MAG: serine/threonine protein kinase [Planctomycetota bacterium]REK49440.1 MAG: serine/threonine protein kinase [Planctomycetota bacterium]